MATKSTTSKTSKRIAEIARASVVASLLPIFFLYMLLDKPDYKIMDAARVIVVPAAQAVGDGLSWPFRAVGRLTGSFREHMTAMRENEELRARLDEALRRNNACDAAIAENQRLEQQLDIASKTQPRAIVARVVLEDSAFRHTTLTISKGASAGVRTGHAVVSMDGSLVGIVTDVFDDMARVRGLADTKSNIPVRVAGSGVYGFLRGNGEAPPSFEFFSDQEFVPTEGILLVSSGIKGNLPNGIPVGTVAKNGTQEAPVRLSAGESGAHEVMVLGFDGKDGYK